MANLSESACNCTHGRTLWLQMYCLPFSWTCVCQIGTPCSLILRLTYILSSTPFSFVSPWLKWWQYFSKCRLWTRERERSSLGINERRSARWHFCRPRPILKTCFTANTNLHGTATLALLPTGLLLRIIFYKWVEPLQSIVTLSWFERNRAGH